MLQRKITYKYMDTWRSHSSEAAPDPNDSYHVDNFIEHRIIVSVVDITRVLWVQVKMIKFKSQKITYSSSEMHRRARK